MCPANTCQGEPRGWHQAQLPQLEQAEGIGAEKVLPPPRQRRQRHAGDGRGVAQLAQLLLLVVAIVQEGQQRVLHPDSCPPLQAGATGGRGLQHAAISCQQCWAGQRAACVCCCEANDAPRLQCAAFKLGASATILCGGREGLLIHLPVCKCILFAWISPTTSLNHPRRCWADSPRSRSRSTPFGAPFPAQQGDPRSWTRQ